MVYHQKIIISLIFVLGFNNAYSSTVTINPNSQVVEIGDVFSINVVGTDFSIALDAGGLDLFFNQNIIRPALLQELPLSVSQIAVYGNDWDTNTQPNHIGGSLQDLFFFSSGAAPSGDFDIVNLWFKAIGLGSSPLDLEESSLNPFAGDGGALTTSILDGNINVIQTPLPAAAWMFISALVGLSAVSKRKS